jgi:hypothetical protein
MAFFVQVIVREGVESESMFDALDGSAWALEAEPKPVTTRRPRAVHSLPRLSGCLYVDDIGLRALILMSSRARARVREVQKFLI